MPTTLLTPGYLFNTDPVCHVIGGRLWVFCAQDQYTALFQVPEDCWNNIGGVHAYSTADLRRWTDHGTAYSTRDVEWCSMHSLWPGDTGVEADGKFFAYPSGTTRSRSRRWLPIIPRAHTGMRWANP